MAIDYDKLGQRIGNLRSRKGLSQEELSEAITVSREHINRIESGKRGVTLDSLIDIANALGVSADDLLVDSLENSASTADSEIHRLLLDCTKEEEYILTQMTKALKAILSSQGI